MRWRLPEDRSHAVSHKPNFICVKIKNMKFGLKKKNRKKKQKLFGIDANERSRCNAAFITYAHRHCGYHLPKSVASVSIESAACYSLADQFEGICCADNFEYLRFVVIKLIGFETCISGMLRVVNL